MYSFEQKQQQSLDFEIDDALKKLIKLGLITQKNNQYQAITLDAALQKLDDTWDNYFSYNQDVNLSNKP